MKSHLGYLKCLCEISRQPVYPLLFFSRTRCIRLKKRQFC